MSALALGVKAASTLALVESMGFEVDYTSVVRWGLRLTRVASNMHAKAQGVDANALNEMVSRAKASAPVRSGNLVNGITGEREGEFYVFRASAVGPHDGADYAPFVEFGTRPHTRPVADDSFFEGGSRRSRRPGHPGTEAQPFFWPAARSVLAERRREQAQTILADAAGNGADE